MSVSHLSAVAIAVLLAPATARAQVWSCPDPSSYAANQPTLDTVALDYDCDPNKGHLGANQCAPAYYSEPLDPNGRLFVWLAATKLAASTS